MQATYAIRKMCNVMCNFLVADQARSYDPTMIVEDQLDVLDGVLLIELRVENGVYKDIVKT